MFKSVSTEYYNTYIHLMMGVYKGSFSLSRKDGEYETLHLITPVGSSILVAKEDLQTGKCSILDQVK